MRKIKGIIFDMDGVLVFTDHHHYLAWKALADRLGIDFSEKDNDRLRGVSRMASLDIILEKYHGHPFSAEEKEALATEKNENYRKLLSYMTPNDVSQEVRDTLTELKRRGYLLSIGSSSKNAKYIMERTDLHSYFDAVSDGTNISRSKPDPEVFLKGAEYLGLAAEACAVVEDAYAGIDAAKAGNMLAVAIGAAVTSPAADIRIDRFSDLLEHFPKEQKEVNKDEIE